MIRYLICSLFILSLFTACQTKNEPAPAEAPRQEILPMKSAEQVKAELEELEERKALEFNIIYISKAERVYIQKNRITHFLFEEGVAPKPVHQNVLADFDDIERYKDEVRKSGILDYQREKAEQKPGVPNLQLTIDGKMRTAVLSELNDAKFKKSIQGLIKGLKEISRTVQK